MRKVLSVSIDGALEKKVKNRVKERGFKSVSEYVNSLLVVDEDLITEDQLLEISKRARSDFKKGKLIKARSLADL